MTGTTRDEARAQIEGDLKRWKAEGIVDPMICSYTDANADTMPDIWGLDVFGKIELRPDATIADTVSVSDGTGLEDPKTEAPNG